MLFDKLLCSFINGVPMGPPRPSPLWRRFDRAKMRRRSCEGEESIVVSAKVEVTLSERHI